MSADIDFRSLDPGAARAKLGELIQLCFRNSPVIALARGNAGKVLVLPPHLLQDIPIEKLIKALLRAGWEDTEIETFLEELYKLRP